MATPFGRDGGASLLLGREIPVPAQHALEWDSVAHYVFPFEFRWGRLMVSSEEQENTVAQFPLVRSDASDLAALIAVVRRLSIARSLSEIMEITTHAARTLMRADGITFVLREGDLCYYAEEDAISPLWKGRRFPMAACISGWCMIESKPAVIPDIYQDPRIPADAYKRTFVRSLAMVPVRQGAPVAALGAYWATRREAASAEVELLQMIANSAALALAYVQLQQQSGVQSRGATPYEIRQEQSQTAQLWDLQETATAAGKAFAKGFDLAHAMARDLGGRIAFWSSGMEQLYGWSRSEAIGRVSHELLKTEFPKPLPEIEADLLKAGHWQGELTQLSRDGNTVVVASHWALHQDDAGQAAWVIEVNNNITELKAAEAELRRAREAAELATQSKSRVLTAVGHDLRQPVQVIRMALDMLGRHPTGAEQSRLLFRADRSVEALATALDKLLETARLQAGVIKPRFEAFALQPLLDGLREQFDLLASSKGLSFHIDRSDAVVRSDFSMLTTILHNLVSNAIKYTARGSVAVSCQAGDGVLAIEVRDTGVGIPADKLDQVFEEFRRLDTTGADGLGLGLAIVRRTAESLGHRLSVASSDREGSVFRVDIPLQQD